MKYFKQQGSEWVTFFGLDESKSVLIKLEVRANSAILVEKSSAEDGNYDTVVADIIKTYPPATVKEWNAFKKEITDYIKQATT